MVEALEGGDRLWGGGVEVDEPLWRGGLGVLARGPGLQRGPDHAMTSVTTPEQTVRPPSRMAKRRPWSMAIGWMSSIAMATLSPGMTISTPSGRLATPVTSVVRK